MMRRVVLRERNGQHVIVGIFEGGELAPEFRDDNMGITYKLAHVTNRYIRYDAQEPPPLPESWEPFVQI